MVVVVVDDVDVVVVDVVVVVEVVGADVGGDVGVGVGCAVVGARLPHDVLSTRVTNPAAWLHAHTYLQFCKGH